MNKKIVLSLGSVLLIMVAVFSFGDLTKERMYTPRQAAEQGIDGYMQYMQSVKADKLTNTINAGDIARVRAQIKSQSDVKFKADWPLKWSFRGPDNYGGRTRCLVIDKDDPNVMYTGGVSGMVFKSTNKGGSWRAITQGADNFGVVSMTQSQSGTILYGTGENGLLLVNQPGEEGSSFNGMGMYRSTDAGETFSLVPGSDQFGNIFVLTAHPTQNLVFAGSQQGVYFSNDDGLTWSQLDAGLIRRGARCRDIKISEDGVALVYVGNNLFRSTNPTDAESYTLVTGLESNNRSAIAWSKTDPNYCYVVSSGGVSFNGQTYGSALVGFYRSTDAGLTFTKEVGSLSQFFNPFTIIGLQAQGLYDMAIAVHPRNKDRVFIGGIGFAEWTLQEGPKMVGNNSSSPFNRFGIHSDKHYITFDDSGKDPVMYICNDGGIAQTTNEELNNYKDISLGLTTTQFFGIAASKEGVVVGGTQDQSTILLTGAAFPRKNGEEVLGGDGFQTEISEYNSEIMFAESQYGNLRRSIAGGTDMVSIWDNRVSASHLSANRPTSYFNNPMVLWEDPVLVDSVKTFGDNAEYDTLINARLYYAMNDGIWMCKNALGDRHEPGKNKEGAIRWFRISDLRNVHNLETTRDGKSLFVTTSNGRLYRIDNLINTQFDTIGTPGYNQIPAGISAAVNMNLSVSGRTVTSVAIDYTNPNRIVATVGNYNNSNYVYICEDALSTSPTWTSIQGNLPQMPVYHAIISSDDPDVIILGTEFGIWATANGTSATPTWAEALDGVEADQPFPRCPVFDLVQVENKSWSGPRIYAGTHGMGVWESKSLLSSVKNQKDATINEERSIAYPNPAQNSVTVQSPIKGAYTLNVYSMNGQIVATQDGTSAGTIALSTAELQNGSYFIEIIGSDSKTVTKLIVQH